MSGDQDHKVQDQGSGNQDHGFRLTGFRFKYSQSSGSRTKSQDWGSKNCRGQNIDLSLLSLDLILSSKAFHSEQLKYKIVLRAAQVSVGQIFWLFSLCLLPSGHKRQDPRKRWFDLLINTVGLTRLLGRLHHKCIFSSLCKCWLEVIVFNSVVPCIILLLFGFTIKRIENQGKSWVLRILKSNLKIGWPYCLPIHLLCGLSQESDSGVATGSGVE